ncbi:hypothetical protein [Roseibacillus ishigakijimensis]|nr:hypothetical protein [Roseibacillus ishigakijimensis]
MANGVPEEKLILPSRLFAADDPANGSVGGRPHCQHLLAGVMGEE